MYIYNVTTNVAETIEKEWLLWMDEIYIPEMLATGKFTGAKLTRVMVQEEMGGKTYAVQYAIKNKETFKAFYIEDASKMNSKMQEVFKESKTLSFQTELEIVKKY